MATQKKKQITPHDFLFKAIMSNKKVIIAFIETFLPEIAPHLNFNSLKIIQTNFISEELREKLADLVVEITSKKHKTLIVFLYEHKSFKEKFLYLKIREYILAIEKYFSTQQTHIPIIIPIIFYHGKEKFEFPNYKELYGEVEPIFFKFIPKQETVFFDIHTYGEQYIKRAQDHFELMLLIGLFYNIFKTPDKMINFLEKLVEKHKDQIRKKRDIVKIALKYLSTFTKFEQEPYKQKIMKTFDIDYEITYEKGSYFDKVVQKKWQEGVKEGWSKRAIENAKRMWEKGFSLEEIIELLALTEEEIAQLKKELGLE